MTAKYSSPVRVYGGNILAGPLFESADARTVVLCDGSGEPTVILARMDDNAWIMGTKSDKDWEEVKARFGVGR